jgi:hypothetical protein
VIETSTVLLLLKMCVCVCVCLRNVVRVTKVVQKMGEDVCTHVVHAKMNLPVKRSARNVAVNAVPVAKGTAARGMLFVNLGSFISPGTIPSRFCLRSHMPRRTPMQNTTNDLMRTLRTIGAGWYMAGGRGDTNFVRTVRIASVFHDMNRSNKRKIKSLGIHPFVALQDTVAEAHIPRPHFLCFHRGIRLHQLALPRHLAASQDASQGPRVEQGGEGEGCIQAEEPRDRLHKGRTWDMQRNSG